MKPITCFLLEPSDVAHRWLRRYVDGNCPLQADVQEKYRYHNAFVKIEDGVVVRGEDGLISTDPYEWPRDDPRWPKACGCGFVFGPDVPYQLFWNQAYRDAAGKLYSIHCSELPGVERAPAGAMWYADWLNKAWKGPDGRCLNVRCPARPDGTGVADWLVDGPSEDNNKPPVWTRTGVPPRVTAHPSIFVRRPHGFHGWLKNGVLTSCSSG